MAKRMTNKRMLEIIDYAMAGEANMYDLERAVGFLLCGKCFGWHYLRLLHGHASVRKSEGILGVVFRDELPERTDQSDRLAAIRVCDAFGKFWQAVSSNAVGKNDAFVDAAG